MESVINEFAEVEKKRIDKAIQNLFQNENIPGSLKSSMLYSLLAGGKRLRPILLIASYKTFQKDISKTIKTALALELIHTYSLIHDDLPAMDDDDFRRGELTNHKKFNEATAILAGDALLTYSFELISNDQLLSDKEKVFIIQSLSKASGPEGMVAGQILDMEGEKKDLTLQELEIIHKNKTGALISFAIIAGAYLGGAKETQLEKLKEYAYYLGLIFQVQDDILDVIGDPDKIGKPVGSDACNEKSTYPNLLGLEGAKKQKEQYAIKAKEALLSADADDSYLLYLLDYFSNRDH